MRAAQGDRAPGRLLCFARPQGTRPKPREWAFESCNTRPRPKVLSYNAGSDPGEVVAASLLAGPPDAQAFEERCLRRSADNVNGETT